MSEMWLAPACKIVRQFEGLAKLLPDNRVAAYPDPATKGPPWTIGYGSTGHDITKGTVWSKSQCEVRLLNDLTLRFGPAVDKMCEGVATSGNEKAALVSFAYNLGEGALEESTLLRLHRDGNKHAAADQFLKWTYAAGKVMPGLVKRRAAERELYLS
jgi:lysozyme